MGAATLRNPVEVEIMGQRLTVASDDSEDHVQKVAKYVNEQMHRLSAGQRIPTTQAALLAALNIASEYWSYESPMRT
jgi:cell division protein ZapA (FtsZ GTPase activity inhibitor)